MRRERFLPVGETLYRKRRGVLVLRDCIVGHIPRYMWPRIGRRKQYRKLPRVTRRYELFDF